MLFKTGSGCGDDKSYLSFRLLPCSIWFIYCVSEEKQITKSEKLNKFNKLKKYVVNTLPL